MIVRKIMLTGDGGAARGCKTPYRNFHRDRKNGPMGRIWH